MRRREDQDKTVIRDKFDDLNAKYYDEERKKLLQQQQLAQRPSYLTRKMKRLFGGAGQTTSRFAIGFMQGGITGLAVGLVSGLYLAIKTRRLSLFFISPILSGASFGFFMGVGYMIRGSSAPLKSHEQLQPYLAAQKWIISSTPSKQD